MLQRKKSETIFLFFFDALGSDLEVNAFNSPYFLFSLISIALFDMNSYAWQAHKKLLAHILKESIWNATSNIKCAQNKITDNNRDSGHCYNSAWIQRKWKFSRLTFPCNSNSWITTVNWCLTRKSGNYGWNVNGRLILSPRTEIFSKKWDFLKGRPQFPNGISEWKMCVKVVSFY